jgi:hypothetical protein
MDLVAFVADQIAPGLPRTFTLPLPGAGAYTIRDLRRLCETHGATCIDLHATDSEGLIGLKVTVDAVPALPPLVALAMVVRDDVRGLERAIVSTLPRVDEIVVAVDGRSAPETFEIARLYADQVVTFQASDIGLDPAAWVTDGIDFARARNFGRAQVRAPWTLVIDADEVLSCASDWRPFVRALPSNVTSVELAVGDSTFQHRDPQRLALTAFRYVSAMHNRLEIKGHSARLDVAILHDPSIRPQVEADRRTAQRAVGIEGLVRAGERGDMHALFHAAKHFIGNRDERGIALAEMYRLGADPHGSGASERVWLALGVAALFEAKLDFARAEMWGVRALLDGPRVEAFVLLGDIAERTGNHYAARRWYECACAVEAETGKFAIHSEIAARFAHRDRLRGTVPEAYIDHSVVTVEDDKAAESEEAADSASKVVA